MVLHRPVEPAPFIKAYPGTVEVASDALWRSITLPTVPSAPENHEFVINFGNLSHSRFIHIFEISSWDFLCHYFLSVETLYRGYFFFIRC